MRIGIVIDSACDLPKESLTNPEAVRLIRQGATPSEIGARLKQCVENTHTYLVPADLFHIYKRASKKGDTSLSWGSYTLGYWLNLKPVLHCHHDRLSTLSKVRGFEAGVEQIFTKAIGYIDAGLDVPQICMSYGGSPAQVSRLPGYSRLAARAAEKGIDILVSPMRATAAINVGPGALSLAFAASGHTTH